MIPAEKEPILAGPRFLLRRLAYVAVAVLLCALAYALRGVLVPVFLAFLIAYALDPLVDRAERRGITRRVASLLLLLTATVVTTVVSTWVVPYCINEFADAVVALPRQMTLLREQLDPWVWRHFHATIPSSWSDVTSRFGGDFRQRAPEMFLGTLAAVFGTLNMVVLVASSFVIPVLAFYLLLDFDAIMARTRQLVPRRYVAPVTDVAREIHVALGRYVRGQLTASLLLASIYSLGLWMLHIRLAIPIGVLTGLLAFVPYVGFGTGVFLAILMAIIDWRGTSTLVGVVAVMMVGQMLDAFLITPRVVGGSVGLKPIEVLLTMMAGASLFGFLGVLLAVPFGAVVKILAVRATRAYLSSHYYQDIPAPPKGSA